MTAVAAPFGLRPVSHPSGIIRPSQSLPIASGYATNLFENTPVSIQADGTLGIAAAGARAIGSFAGVEYTDSDGRRRPSNRWVAGTVATDIVAYYTSDPDLLYEIQANATLVQLNIGEQFDWTTATTGNSTTGLSTVALNAASSAANAGLQVLGFSPYVDNLVGDAFPIVQVRISEHQIRADVAAF
jgi:hypothetical protein